MKFEKGQSGNPKGKPKGARDKRTELRALFEPFQAKLIRKAVTLALKGDTTALKICIDRIVAPLRPRDAPTQFRPLAGTPTQMGEQVLHALARGDLALDEAAAVMQIITAQSNIAKADELERRIAAIERALQEKPHHAVS